jgi:hypothetical protein
MLFSQTRLTLTCGVDVGLGLGVGLGVGEGRAVVVGGGVGEMVVVVLGNTRAAAPGAVNQSPGLPSAVSKTRNSAVSHRNRIRIIVTPSQSMRRHLAGHISYNVPSPVR